MDPGNGRQDLQGLGLFLMASVGDKDTNPVGWSVAAGFSGCGSLPGRDADTWGIGYFHNDLQRLAIDTTIPVAGSNDGVEAYYDIALLPSLSLSLNAQWTKSAFEGVEDATLLGARLNASF